MPSSLLAACGLGLVAFVATNVDDVFLLLAFFAHPAYRAWQVVLGQFLGMAALIALSLGLALGAAQFPAAWVGLFGLLPIAIGVKELLELRGEEEVEQERPASRARRSWRSPRSRSPTAGTTSGSTCRCSRPGAQSSWSRSRRPSWS